ncbi:uncharacterized protein [Venturia canescens]|uniref:uncharacterized protein n=1 Tax=Venturia canescens TaxID=32260 RepID=UPI001C9CCC5D|nr:uncharacterized protein LOC122416610 [Venturia canescens]
MQTLSLNFAIFKCCGLWRPFLWFTGWKVALYRCYSFFSFLLISSFLVSACVELFASFDSVEEFALGSFLFLTMVGVFTKMILLIQKQQEIINLTDAMGNDVCQPRDRMEIEMIASSERDAEWIFFRYTALTMSSTIYTAIKSMIVNMPNRKLTYKSWFPYAYDATQIVYLSTFIHQTIAVAMGALINSAFDTFFPGLIILTCSQIKILKYRFEALPQIIGKRKKSSESNCDEDDEKENQELEAQLLTDCIRHHVRIFQLASTLNGIFGFVAFLQFSISSLVLCVSVYELTKEELFSPDFVSTVMYLASMLMEIYIFCYYGNELSLQSVDICQAIYRMDWTSLHIGTKRSLIVIMLNSQRPITFVCYNVISLSLDAFTSLIKLSYSVYNSVLDPMAIWRAIPCPPCESNWRFIYSRMLRSFCEGRESIRCDDIRMRVCTFLISQLIHLLQTIEGAIEDFATNTFMLITTICVTCKMGNLLKHQELIESIIDIFHNDICAAKSSNEIEIQNESEKKMRTWIIFNQSLVGFTIVTITISSFVTRSLPFNGWIPFEHKTFVGFWCAYAHQTSACVFCAAIGSSFDLFICNLLNLAYAHLEILKARLQWIPSAIDETSGNWELFSGEATRNLEARILRKCVYQHLYVIKFTKSVNETFGTVIFIQCAVSTYVLCISTYLITRVPVFSPEFTFLMAYMNCMLVQIFLYCWHGNELILQSLAVGDAVFGLDWPFLSVKTKRTLITIMARTLRPIIFTSGHVVTLNLESFNSLLKLSYSTYNVLQKSPDQ